MNSLMRSDYDEFQTVPASMFTIFRCFTDGCSAYNGTPLQEQVREEHGAIFILFYVLTIMLVTFGLFNLIMALFIENIMDSGRKRRQKKLGLDIQFMREKFENVFAQLILHCKTATGRKHHLLTKGERDALWAMDVRAAFNSLPADLSITSDIFHTWTERADFVELIEEADIDSSNASQLF